MIGLILAVSVLLHWTNPPGPAADRYEAQRFFRTDTQWSSAHLWGDSARTKDKLTPQPALAIGRDSGYVYCDDDSLQTMRFRIRQCGPGGCSEWSNEVVLKRLVNHDECYFLQRGGLLFTDPVYPKGGVLAFNLALGDSLGIWNIVTQTYVQTALRLDICGCSRDSLGSYWALNGQRRRDCN